MLMIAWTRRVVEATSEAYSGIISSGDLYLYHRLSRRASVAEAAVELA